MGQVKISITAAIESYQLNIFAKFALSFILFS